MDRSTIESSGVTTMGELVQQVPAISGAATNPAVNNGGGTGAANPSIGGSSGFENQYVFDGVNVTNAGYGALGAFSNVYGSQGSGILRFPDGDFLRAGFDGANGHPYLHCHDNRY